MPKKTRALVTGGAGFIGSHITAALLEQGWEVIVIDDYSTGKKQNLPDSNFLTQAKESITSYKAIAPLFKGVDYVFHEAALVSVPESVASPVKAVEANTIGTLNVLEASRQAGVKKLVSASSAAVYGQLPGLPKSEESPLDPRSPYAVTKISSEHYCRMYSKEHGLPTASLRYFNVYGPRQDPSSQYAAAIPKFISQSKANKQITIFGDGKQTRDFVFVSDVVKANLLAAQEPKADGRVLNVCSNTQITIEELAMKIISLTNSKSSIAHAEERAGDVKHSRGDNSLMKRLLGFTPGTGLDEGLSQTIRWLSSQ